MVPTRRPSLSLFVLALVPLASSGAEPKRPTISLGVPVAGEHRRHDVPISVTGRVDSPVPTDVRIEVYHVREDGDLIPAGGFDGVRVAADGGFRCDVQPASPGWPPGTLRIVASLDVMPHVRTIREVSVDVPAAQADWVIADPPSSGAVVDLDANQDAAELPRGRRFLVRGTVPAAAPGQFVLRLVGFRDGKDVTYGSVAPTLLPGGERPWFEAEFVAPKEDGRYELRLEETGPAAAVLRQVKVWTGEETAAAPAAAGRG